MAFHVACPITCKRICFCTLGFPGKLQSDSKRAQFLEEVLWVEEFFGDSLSVRVERRSTVQVPVPRILPPVPVVDGGDGVVGDGEEILSAQTKRAALQRRAMAVSLAAEDYARRFEAGNLAELSGVPDPDYNGEEQGSSAAKVMCRICFSGENEGSERAVRMLSCKLCTKKYHRSCLRSWAEYRDLFHWSSWACPSCRICEVCRRTGDPNKFMFCKRCDGAYHSYCQQPPHKNRTPGPFLCPKHTKCHSCGSKVSGSGLSTRWFLGYTCCDACGRLFQKGKFCPVCLKVYRDSESTPMVCCDICERWVHCDCDGISDEKYRQFQADGNLQYKCAACRGDCYQVRDIDDAIQEIWRRRDKADQNLISSLRAAAGLPSQEEVFSVSPYSDDEDNGPVILKGDHGNSLKLSVKGFVEKQTKNAKEYGKKSAKGSSHKKHTKKKESQMAQTGKFDGLTQSSGKLQGPQSSENTLIDEKADDMRSQRSEGFDSVSSTKNGKVSTYDSHPGTTDHKLIDDVGLISEERADKVLQAKNTGKQMSKSDTMKGTKLVIHLGARNKNVTNSPKSEASSFQKEQDGPASNGSEDDGHFKRKDDGQHRVIDKQISGEYNGTSKLDYQKGSKIANGIELSSSKQRQSGLIKIGKAKYEKPDSNLDNVHEDLAFTQMRKPTVVFGKRMEPLAEAILRNDEVDERKHGKGMHVSVYRESVENSSSQPVSSSSTKDPKPLLRLKFKNPYIGNRSSWGPPGEEEKTFVKGQRSKRKRPPPFTEKALLREEESEEGQLDRESPIDEVMDANWILKKLGKDAIGKRVEVHQSSDNSWHKGVVTTMIEGTSALTVSLDDGRAKTLELGKQGIRFISQKQKRTKTILV